MNILVQAKSIANAEANRRTRHQLHDPRGSFAGNHEGVPAGLLVDDGLHQLHRNAICAGVVDHPTSRKFADAMIGGLRIGKPRQQQQHASRARLHAAASTPDTISAAAITSSR